MPLQDLYKIFPKLRGTNPRLTSAIDCNYNCVGYAVNDHQRWWEPFDFFLPAPPPELYWPDHLPRNQEPATYILFFEGYGFECCADESVDQGNTKIAIYTEDGEFRHVAYQRSNGRWRSKIGKQEDISHELRALEASGPYAYGKATIFMKRPND